MLIPIDKIKPSPNPVRTSWDEDKMNELAQSIKEQGLIVPIKVREVCPIHGTSQLEDEINEFYDPDYDTERWITVCKGERPDEDGDLCPCTDFDDDLIYEIIYGHRRVEACRRARLSEVEAIVEGVDDTQQLIQAFLENVQREGMSTLDKARAKRKLQEQMGYNNLELQRAGFVRADTASKWDTYLEEYEDGNLHNVLSNQNIMSKGEGVEAVTQIKRALPHSPDDRKAVLDKVARENLSYNQARKVADAVANAPTPQAKEKLLQWEYSPTIHDPELIKERAKTHGAHDPIYRDNKPSPQKAFDDSPEIKMLIDSMNMAIATFLELITSISTVANIGKLAPEGRQFMATKLKTFRAKIDNLIAELED